MKAKKHFGIGVLSLVMFLSGCSTHVVRCNGKLSPINTPVPVSKLAQPQPAEASP